MNISLSVNDAALDDYYGLVINLNSLYFTNITFITGSYRLKTFFIKFLDVTFSTSYIGNISFVLKSKISHTDNDITIYSTKSRITLCGDHNDICKLKLKL